MAALSRRGRTAIDIWPGFVDALATLLMVIIFLLMIFVVAQFYLTEALSGRDQALDQLNREVAELADLLALEQQTTTDLRASVSQISSELQNTLAERSRFATEAASLRDIRDSLTSRLAGMQDRFDTTEAERSRLVAALATTESRLAERDAALAEREAALAASQKTVAERDAALAASEASLEDRIRALEAAQARASTAEAALANTELLLAEQTTARAASKATLTERAAALEAAAAKLRLTEDALARTEQAYADSAAELAKRMKELEEANKTIATDRESIELQLKELAELRQDIVAMVALREDLEKQLQELMGKTATGAASLTAERAISAAAKAQVALLNRQLAELRAQITALNEVLEASEARDKEQKTQIVDLGKRLNAALASKVQELQRYRSEFFGRLRDVLGDRQDIRIVGDRFVFQSEVLFASGEAELGQAGKQQLAALARTLLDIAGRIPDDIDWILQIDGHTDRLPIRTDEFPSNWELSTARAISVVRFLEQQRIPARRLAATGYAEFQPIDPTEAPGALARNRRIELKFTQR